MGTPPSSLNCLVGDFFLDFAAECAAIRVPSPAAGMMTKTFIGAISIVQGLGFCAWVSGSSRPVPRSKTGQARSLHEAPNRLPGRQLTGSFSPDRAAVRWVLAPDARPQKPPILC